MNLSTPAKVGILVLASLIALGIMIIWKTEIFMVSEGYSMIGTFNSIEGLTIGSEVRYRGFKVGKVMEIDPGPYAIRLRAVVDKKIKFPADSELRVAYDGIVGQKYLEVKPGTAQEIYAPPQVLQGIKTAAIVDFVDIGSKNLEETKRILENIRMIVENPKLQKAFLSTVFTADKVATDLELLTSELRQTNIGIRDIVADPKFQKAVKGTIRETEKTLSSANRFFDSVGKMNLRASGGIELGTVANTVKGNVDIIRDEKNYFRFGMGEGPSRTLSLLDILFTSKVAEKHGFRLGVINNQLGGGLTFYPNKDITWRADIYDINNPRPNWAKLRIGYERQIRDYMDLTITGDDLVNQATRNFTIGIQVKPPGERIY